VEVAATVEVAAEAVAITVAAEAVAITVAVVDLTAVAVRTEAEVTPEDTAASES